VETPASERKEESIRIGASVFSDVSPEDIVQLELRCAGLPGMGRNPSEHLTKALVTDAEWTKQTRWTYYDRGKLRMFEQANAWAEERDPAD